MSELDEHAARGRARKEQEVAATQAGPPWWKSLLRREPEPARLTRTALASGFDIRVVVILGLAALVTGGAFVGLWAVASSPIPEIGAVAVASIAIVVVTWRLKLLANQRADAEVQRLRAMPFEADWLRYQADLGKRRSVTVVTMNARFRTPLDGAQCERIGNAAHGLVRKGQARCTAHILTIKSERIDTYTISTNDAGNSHHHNHAVHRWVRDVLDAVMKIHAEHPVASLEILVSP